MRGLNHETLYMFKYYGIYLYIESYGYLSICQVLRGGDHGRGFTRVLFARAPVLGLCFFVSVRTFN